MTKKQGSSQESLGSILPVIAIFDLLGVWLGAHMAYMCYGLIKGFDVSFAMPGRLESVVLLACVLTPSFLTWLGGYRSWRGFSLLLELRTVLLAWVAVFVVFAVVMLMTKTGDMFPRIWVGSWWLISFIMVGGARLGSRIFLRRMRLRGHDVKRVVLVGAGDLLVRTYRMMRNNPWAGYRVIGYYADRDMDMPGIERLGDCEGVIEGMGGQDAVDEVWLVIPMSEELLLRRILDSLGSLPINVRMVPDMFAYQLLNYSVDQIAGLPILNLSCAPYASGDKLLKSITEWSLALMIVFITSPLMLCIALAIRLSSPGPIIYKQLRHGWNGEPIEVYKFRTMVLHEDRAGPIQLASRADPRITRIGRILRATSLDELPQFFNVLEGKMSIVGPRPHPVSLEEEYHSYISSYPLRYKVKPGITGWAQVNGYRGNTDTPEKLRGRVEHDLYYIENWSFWLDIRIIILTIIKGLWHDNAY